MSPDLDSSIQSGANEAFAELDLVDLNVILHRADGEEKDATGMFLLSLTTSLHFSALCPSLDTYHASFLIYLASARAINTDR
jgi:hypothetical protein